MAFTESQQLDICTILEVEKPILDQALIYNASFITAAVETKVIAELTRWTTAGANFVKVHPRERNYGVEINSENEKADIRRNIATLLLMTETVYGGSGSGSRAQVQILRG
jgi:hypothetical protein